MVVARCDGGGGGAGGGVMVVAVVAELSARFPFPLFGKLRYRLSSLLSTTRGSLIECGLVSYPRSETRRFPPRDVPPLLLPRVVAQLLLPGLRNRRAESRVADTSAELGQPADKEELNVKCELR